MAKAEPFTSEDTPQKLTGIDFADMQAHLADGYCVKHVVGRNTMAAIIGQTGSGKTFFAADLAVHIAAGRPWREHPVTKGLVVYAALEGPVSAERRFVAARTALSIPATIPLRLTPGPISLRNEADVTLLGQFIREAEAHFGEKCIAVFIDTLSRALDGGDENRSEDMGALIKAADALRLATGATVFLVHHLGKDQSRGARGHSSFKAAIDTEIEITPKDDVHVAVVKKQRDGPSGETFAFRLASVDLGRDEEGEPVTSCFVDQADTPVPPALTKIKGKNKVKLFAALKEFQRVNPDKEIIGSTELEGIAKAQGIFKARKREAVEGLVKDGVLKESVGGYRFVQKGFTT